MNETVAKLKVRKLRIAISALCVIFLVSLIGLWVQSYYRVVYLSKQLTTGDLTLQTNRGQFQIWSTSPVLRQKQATNSDWNFGVALIANGDSVLLQSSDEPPLELLGFRYQTVPRIYDVLTLPFWPLLLSVAVAGVLPWLRWRIVWRSALSVACLLPALLLIGLWIRSYSWFDITDRNSAINVCSMNGRLLIGETLMLLGRRDLNPGVPVPNSQLGICILSPTAFELVPVGGGISLPHWLAILLVIPLAAIPWLRFRFSLRAMLAATTLVAIVLCVVGYALRK